MPFPPMRDAMMKSHMSIDLIGLLECLFRDVQAWTPLTDEEVGRDIATISQLVHTRGEQYLLITFPEVGKVFDQSLSKGQLLPLPFPGFGKKVGSVPRLLSGLFLRVFSADGLILEDPDLAAVTALRQLLYCFKKVRKECPEHVVRATYADFVETDQRLRSPSLNWGDSSFDGAGARKLRLSDGASEHAYDELNDLGCYPEPWYIASVLDTVQQYADCVTSTFPELPGEWKPGHGTGAVADLRVGRDFKYLFPTWPERLEREFPLADYAFANYAMWSSTRMDGLFDNKEIPSRLATVPKTLKGPRLIASEPTSLQYCQQAVLEYLVDSVSKSSLRNCIDFVRQDLNGDLALTASKTQSHATIDLSAASDRVSLWLVERIFRSRPDILRALQATRTLSTTVPNWGELPLKKFTTMGAATTFPVQSIIFALIIGGVILHEQKAVFGTGAERLAETIRRGSHRFRVFGDDLIVPNHLAVPVINVLHALGLKVNDAKTFTDGNFRESCGVDAYAGVDVAPAYILEFYDEAAPTRYGSVLEQCNNFHKKGCWNAAEYILRTIPSKILKDIPVVSVDSGHAGIASFCGYDLSHLRVRQCPTTQQEAVYVVRVKTSSKRHYAGGGGSLLQYFLEDPSPDVQWTSGIDCRRPGRVTRSWRPTRLYE